MSRSEANHADHSHIEAEEDARERIFEGLPEDADLTQDHVAVPDALDIHQHASGEGPTETFSFFFPDSTPGAEETLNPGDPVPPKPRMQRADPGARPERLGPDHHLEGKPKALEERLRVANSYKSR
jgi:hypothetical protein